MMKWLILFFVINVQTGFGQESLHIEGTTPNLYIIHTVSPKETLYGISRMYNIAPNELSTYNKLDTDVKLSVGQQLHIPLNKTNFLQGGIKSADEVLIPIYYVIAEHEGLYRISINHNKVDIGLLKTWNQLTSDAIVTGANLIIGYLKVKQGQSPLANNNGKVETTKPSIENTSTNNTSVTTNNNNVNTIPNNSENNNTPIINTSSSYGGFFEEAYKEETQNSTTLQNVSGDAAAFKSTSGWQDRKYYALINNVQPGTFIKISNIINGGYVYAKVLGGLPEMKENNGLLIRISNAAAAILNINDGNKTAIQVTKPY